MMGIVRECSYSSRRTPPCQFTQTFCGRREFGCVVDNDDDVDVELAVLAMIFAVLVGSEMVEIEVDNADYDGLIVGDVLSW